jgi:hypothetical protein
MDVSTFKQVHAATHPGALLGRDNAASVPTTPKPAEKLFAVLPDEGEEEKQ